MDPEPNTSKAASLVHSKASVVKAVPVNTSKAASLAFAKDGFPIPPVLGPCPMPQVPPPPLTQPPQFEITAGGCIGTKMPPTQPGQLFLPGAPPPPPMLLPGGPTLSPLGPPPPGPPMAPPPMDITAAELVAAVDAAMARVVAGSVPPGLGPGSEPGLLPGQLHSPVQGPPPGPPASGPAEKVEWEAHKSQQGMPYFFCRKTGESRWVKPTGPQDVIVDAKPAAKQVQAAPKAAPAASIKDRIGEPESWETIGKTGWSRVQTDKGFTYFYHKKQKKTSWTCPPEIEKDVAELDGCLGAVEEVEESNEESNAKEDREDPERMADEVPKDDAQTEVTKPSKAERAEKRAQQVEEEQKLAKEKEKLRNFKQLLLEKGVKAFDKYEKWLPKLVHDPRFSAITGQKERKLLFDMLAKRIDSEKRKTQAVHKLKGREAFRELLTKADEMELLHGRSVERALSAMERRFGDDERWDAVAEAKRERMVAEAVEEATKRVEKEKDEARAAFRALVLRTLSSLKKDGKDDAPSFSHVRRHFEGDPCWPKLGPTEREGMYSRIVRELEESRRKQRAKQRQIQLEVEEARKKRRLTESEERVFSVLAERVKNPFSLTWEEAKEELGDFLQDLLQGLKDEELEQMYLDYQKRSIDARREAWLCILDAAGFDAIGPELEFEEVVERAFDARTDAATARAFHGMPEEVLKAAWLEWRERAYDLAIEDCQKWLRTCEHLRGCEDVEPTGGDSFDRLLRRLAAKDVRFRRLNGRPEQQTRLLAGRLRELRSLREKGHTKGEDDELDE